MDNTITIEQIEDLKKRTWEQYDFLNDKLKETKDILRRLGIKDFPDELDKNELSKPFSLTAHIYKACEELKYNFTTKEIVENIIERNPNRKDFILSKINSLSTIPLQLAAKGKIIVVGKRGPANLYSLNTQPTSVD